MENNNKIVKVYSNNSKKARLKRRKNRFQRIWDAEKQTYVKVRKAKFYIKCTKKEKVKENVEAKMANLKRRKETPKKPKSVPVIAKAKPETTQKVHKEPARVHGKTTSITTAPKTKVYCIGGVNYNWDKKTLSYKKAA